MAAWAAHVTGDEDAEHRYASELLSRADAAGDPELRLEVIRATSVRGHPGEACELIEPCLRECPGDEVAAGIYAEALARAHAQAEPARLEAEYWQAAERGEFDALAVDVAVTYPVAGVSGSPDAD